MTNQDRVREFHKSFGLPVLDQPRVPSPERVGLRRSLLREESDEALAEFKMIQLLERYISGESQKAIARLAKELADVLYVTYGAAAEFGIDLDEVFAEVHASNMSKLNADGEPVRREDGKILKSHRYEPADIDRIIAAQGSLF